MAKSIRHIATVPANLSTRVGGNMESALEVQDASPTSNSDTDISPGRASPSQFSQQSDPSGGSGSRPPINFTLPIMNGPSAVEANKKDTDDTPATMTAAPSASRRQHRRAGDWEIMQGLRSGQKCEERPEKFEGYILKRRKWPLKGWHKRFFCLEKGILIYAKSTTEMAKGKIHGSVDLGLSVISTKTKGRRIDIDAEEFIYHLKVKNQAQFLQWVSQLRHHRLYRQHEIAYGSREAPKITSPVEEIPCGGNLGPLNSPYSISSPISFTCPCLETLDTKSRLVGLCNNGLLPGQQHYCYKEKYYPKRKPESICTSLPGGIAKIVGSNHSLPPEPVKLSKSLSLEHLDHSHNGTGCSSKEMLSNVIDATNCLRHSLSTSSKESSLCSKCGKTVASLSRTQDSYSSNELDGTTIGNRLSHQSLASGSILSPCKSVPELTSSQGSETNHSKKGRSLFDDFERNRTV